jgi:hypothetical protein
MGSPIQGEVAILQGNNVNANVTNTPNVTVVNSSTKPVPTTVTNTVNVMKQPNALLLGSVIDGSVTGGINIFSSALSVSQPSKIKIIVVASDSGVLKLEITSGTTTVSGSFNNDNDLVANSWYEFEIDLPGGVSINLQYSVSTTLTIFVIATPLG